MPLSPILTGAAALQHQSGKTTAFVKAKPLTAGDLYEPIFSEEPIVLGLKYRAQLQGQTKLLPIGEVKDQLRRGFGWMRV
ncbi:MAG: hypothetical protein E1N59_2559 [Puniceicoccaceae bacterium 5H]|nr:MAG: hypothetical protein E1N59_2559 [Puniceicoccaceae bacterium 5H]